MSWTAIVGQPLAVRLLRQAVSAGKAAHSYLFTGPEGVGKRTVALELAKALNCHSPTERGGCDSCPSCIKINSVPLVHPDLAYVRPDGRFIKTDQMRELQAEMYAKPNEGRYRVAIIDAADRMNPEAGNRMLKLLEEPPAHAVFVLVTNNLSGVLPTVTSRCQVVNYSPLGVGEIAEVLHSRFGLEMGQAQLFASLSGGSIGRAVAISQNPEVSQRRDDCYELLSNLHQLDDFGLLSKADALEKQKEQLDEWLEMVLVWLRDALLLSQAGLDKLMINADRLDDVQVLARLYRAESLLGMLDAVIETRSSLQRNANVRLALDLLLLRLRSAQQVGSGV